MSGSASDAPVDERFVTFACEGETCVGVLSSPGRGVVASTVGVLIVVGGPQYRAGSHRQFVHAARAFARAGFPALRFDYRGMGDSEGRARSFEDVDPDIAAAVVALRDAAGVARVVLWGLCDGASAALMHAAVNGAVAGVVALNPWARSPGTQASTRLRHYYVDRLLSRAFWAKLLRGRIDVGKSLGELGHAVGTHAGAAGSSGPGYLRRMQEAWSRFRGPVLIVLSGRDYTAREFETWIDADRPRRTLLRSDRTHVVRLPDADHTFAEDSQRRRAEDESVRWLRELGNR